MDYINTNTSCCNTDYCTGTMSSYTVQYKVKEYYMMMICSQLASIQSTSQVHKAYNLVNKSINETIYRSLSNSCNYTTIYRSTSNVNSYFNFIRIHLKILWIYLQSFTTCDKVCCHGYIWYVQKFYSYVEFYCLVIF